MMTALCAQYVMTGLRMASTNVLDAESMPMADVHSRSLSYAQRLFILSKCVRLLQGVLLHCSTPIESSSNLPRVTRRSRECSMASTWMDFYEVCLMRMRTICKCYDKLKVCPHDEVEALD